MKRLAVFVSGNGSNAENIIRHFEGNNSIKVEILISNKPDAYALKRAENLGVKSDYYKKSEFYDGTLLKRLIDLEIDYVILAGFLLLVPKDIISHFSKRMLNIHPALLPKYGGKGMYGDSVHKAVCDAKENKTGITIHQVTEIFDDGECVFQATCDVLPTDDYKSVAEKVHKLEYEHFPRVINEYINKV